jgi:sugar phosphate isomerase/epimerase
MTIAFSTCWNSSRHTDGETMLREIKEELGFDLIELGHGVRISLMPGVQKMFDAGEVRFSSLHNFCPLPVEVTSASPDCYSFSSSSAVERQRAVKQTMQTIDFAKRLGAAVVVLHLGFVPMKPVTEPLIVLAREGKVYSREFVRRKIEAIAKREANASPWLENVTECLKPIIEHAASKNVHLGIENRRDYENIPSEREIFPLLTELDSAHVGYWHDFGHLQVKENLGFVDHEEWLRDMGPRALGCHVQDCVWPSQDHQPPFAGDIDLEKLVPLLPPSCLFVWEMSPRKTAEEIRRSVTTWKERFGE